MSCCLKTESSMCACVRACLSAAYTRVQFGGVGENHDRMFNIDARLLVLKMFHLHYFVVILTTPLPGRPAAFSPGELREGVAVAGLTEARAGRRCGLFLSQLTHLGVCGWA